MRDQPNDSQLKKAMELASSPAGQQLLSHLRKYGGDDFRTAMDKAANGDYEGAKAALSELMSSPEFRKMLQGLGG